MSQLFASGSQSTGASASFPLMNIQGLFRLGLTAWISLQSRGLSRVSLAPQFESISSSGSPFFMVQLSHPYMTAGKTIALTMWTFVGKVMSLIFNMLSRYASLLPELYSLR